VIAHKRSTATVVGLLVAVAGFSSCATGPAMHHDRSSPMSYDGGADLPSTMMTGHAMATSEQDYLVTMVAHHREAIVAAGQLERSGRPELRRLGRRIAHAQAQQVRQMRSWLDRWYWAAPLPAHYQPMMSDLSVLDGDDLDRTFLVEMVHHHMMAVMMSRQLEHAGLVRHRQVGRFATAVALEQAAEIALMRRWLTDWELR